MRTLLAPTLILASLIVGGCNLIAGCSLGYLQDSPAQNDLGPAPSVRVSLSAYGLPENFFGPGFDTKCSARIIQYRFLVWLDGQNVAVGFNTSPNCRVSPDRPVQGALRIIVFDLSGAMKASRTLPYLADGNGEVVADGEAMPGPRGTLLVRIESVNLDPEGRRESPSGVRLLNSRLEDVMQRDGFLEQTTLADHALVFQDGFVTSGPRSYSIIDGPGARDVLHQQVDWPTGTMDRKLGEHELAFMHCQQELSPGQHTTTNTVYAGAKTRCTLNVLREDRSHWTQPLKDGETAALIGILSDGSVVGEIHARDSDVARLVLWRKDQSPIQLPWLPREFVGSIDSATPDFSRYAAFATRESAASNAFARVFGNCAEPGNGRWFVFDRNLSTPLVSRAFPGNGRAGLSPDGAHYASFEAGELRIFPIHN
jgi:hypothetical protein